MSATDLRNRIHNNELLITPEIYNGLTAKIAEDVGFDAAIMGGFATSASMGIPEPVISMAEVRDRVNEVTDHSALPFVVDGATGFGSEAHTYRTVKEFVNAGAAGIFIEDQVPPRRMGVSDADLELLEIEEMEAKIRAAVRARDEADGDIVIVAKTQAATKDRQEYESMEEAADRINRYMDAGAELGCLYPKSEADAEYAVAEVDGPLKHRVVPSKEYSPSFDKIDEMGYAVANTPTISTITAAKTIRNHYKALFDSKELTVDEGDVAEFKEYVYALQYERYEQFD